MDVASVHPALRKKSNREWLEGQLDFICDLGSRVGPIRPRSSHEYGLHTALKLAALNHSLGVFLPVARKWIDKAHRFDSAIYVDLFAGCGATRVPQTGDWLAGSPIIAAGSRYRFDRVLCVEKDGENAEALRARLSEFRDRDWTVLEGDCNNLATALSSQVRARNPLAFVFVDPQGMEIRWSTLETLSRLFPCMDLLFNFTYGAERVLGDLRKGRIAGSRVMEAFAGPDWPELLLDENRDLVGFVEERISSVLGRPVGAKVLIRDIDNRPRYFLILRVRRTSGGSSFFAGYEDMLKRLASLTPLEVLGVLNDKFRRSLTAYGQGSADDRSARP